MSDPRRQLGLKGEQLAERFLKGRGLRTLARRFSTPMGEIDLIMRDRDTVVFVEVKTLSNDSVMNPHEHITHEQRQHMCKAARAFINANRWTDRPCRFDVVGVVLPEDGEPRIRHIPDAFVPERW